jgi:hypothetical protein
VILGREKETVTFDIGCEVIEVAGILWKIDGLHKF